MKDNNSIEIIDLSLSKTILTLQIPVNEVSKVFFSTDNKQILVIGKDSYSNVWDINSGKSISQSSPSVLFLNEYATQIVSSNGKYAAETIPVTLGGTTVSEISNNREIYRSEEGGKAFAFSPDNKLIAIGRYTLELVSLDSGQSKKLFENNQGAIRIIKFSPDGKLLTTIDQNGVIIIWETSTGNILNRLTGHNGKVTNAFFSNDSRYIVTTSQDKTAMVWDAYKGTMQAKFQGSTSPIFKAAFSPDGTKVTMLDNSGFVFLYKCETCGSFQSLLELARNRITRNLSCLERNVYLKENNNCPLPTITPKP